MPKFCADRIIIFCVVGLVTWGIIGLPALNFFSRSDNEPTEYPSNQRTADQSNTGEPWLTKDAAGFFTFWLAIFAGVQALLFLWQLWLIRESLDDAKIAAEAATESAKAARESADTAKLAMVNESRAFIHYNGCRWISHRDTEDDHIFWRIRPLWINSGNTPTRQMRVHVRYELLDAEMPPDYPFIINARSDFPAAIAPHGLIESAHFDISGDDLVEVSKGNKFFYIWGVATYRDVFPGTNEHITKFCVQATRIGGDPARYWDDKENPVDIGFSTYRRHNCADEDCENQS